MAWRSTGYGNKVRHFKVKSTYQSLSIPKAGIRAKLSLIDPVQAQESAQVLYGMFQTTNDRETKKRIKKALVSAANRAQAANQTFIAAQYRQVYTKMKLPKKGEER